MCPSARLVPSVPAAPGWRWLLGGLAIGLAIGSVAVGVVVRHRNRAADESDVDANGPADAAEDGPGTDTVDEGTDPEGSGTRMTGSDEFFSD